MPLNAQAIIPQLASRGHLTTTRHSGWRVPPWDTLNHLCHYEPPWIPLCAAPSPNCATASYQRSLWATWTHCVACVAGHSVSYKKSYITVGELANHSPLCAKQSQLNHHGSPLVTMGYHRPQWATCTTMGHCVPPWTSLVHQWSLCANVTDCHQCHYIPTWFNVSYHGLLWPTWPVVITGQPVHFQSYPQLFT